MKIFTTTDGRTFFQLSDKYGGFWAERFLSPQDTFADIGETFWTTSPDGCPGDYTLEDGKLLTADDGSEYTISVCQTLSTLSPKSTVECSSLIKAIFQAQCEQYALNAFGDANLDEWTFWTVDSTMAEYQHSFTVSFCGLTFHIYGEG